MPATSELKIVFMGTPEFAVPSLRTLLDHNLQVAAVVTAVDKPSGRGLQVHPSPVKQLALERHLPVLQPNDLGAAAFVEALRQLAADVFVVVAFRILPAEVFRLPPKGTINLHASLLPRYRGAAPIQWAIINGESETGVTTFLIDEKVDTGNLLLQKPTPIGEHETAGELHDRLAELGAELLLETLAGMAGGHLKPQPQVGEPTRAPKITREIAAINWHQSAVDICNRIRGLNPIPGAFTYWQGKLLKIFRAHPVDVDLAAAEPGTVCRLEPHSGELIVATGKGFLAIDEIQLQGKRRMTVADFLRGHHVLQSERLGPRS